MHIEYKIICIVCKKKANFYGGNWHCLYCHRDNAEVERVEHAICDLQDFVKKSKKEVEKYDNKR